MPLNLIPTPSSISHKIPLYTMFGNWDPVGDVQKGMNDAQEKVQEGMQVAGKATGEAQNQTQEGAQNAAEQMNQGANRFKEDAQKGMTEVGENVKDGVEQATKSTGDGLAEMHRNSVEEPLRKLAEAIDGIINSALPGAAPKEGSPYEHIPGNPPHESILLSATLLDLKDGSVLRGLCQKADGSWNPSEIELNHHYAVTEGKLTSDGAGFMDAGHNFWLEPGESSVMLKGKLNDSEDQVEVDLSICIVVKDGQFAFERHDGPWGRDGVFARKFERLPVAGYIIAAIQAGSGNEDHTQRALARCTSSTIVTIAAVAGALLHGPLGGGIAAGLAAPLGMLAESHIANGIEDPRLRDEFEEATIGRAIVEALTKTIGGEAGGYALEYTSEWLSSSSASMVSRTIEAIKGALSGASLGLAQDVINSQAGIAESLALALIGKIALALKGDESALREWTNVCGLAGTKN